MQNNKAAGRQLPPRTKKTPQARAFSDLSAVKFFQLVIDGKVIDMFFIYICFINIIIHFLIPKRFGKLFA